MLFVMRYLRDEDPLAFAQLVVVGAIRVKQFGHALRPLLHFGRRGHPRHACSRSAGAGEELVDEEAGEVILPYESHRVFKVLCGENGAVTL